MDRFLNEIREMSGQLSREVTMTRKLITLLELQHQNNFETVVETHYDNFSQSLGTKVQHLE